MPLHSTSYCGAWIRHWCLQVHPPPPSRAWPRTNLSTRRPSTGLRFCSPSSKDGQAQFRFALWVSSFFDSTLFSFLSSSAWYRHICSCFSFFSSWCRVHIASPIRILNAEIFATPSATFELPPYASELAHRFAEAPSPPPSRIRPYNIGVLDFVDIEAEQGEESDTHSSQSGWLFLVHL